MAKRWPRKMAKAKGGSRRRVAFAQTLGTQVVGVLGVLGEGATAVVFSCKSHEDQRDVAVKIEHQVRAYFSAIFQASGFASFFLSIGLKAGVVASFEVCVHFVLYNSVVLQVKAPSIPWECFTMLQLREKILHRHHSDGTNSHRPLVVVSLLCCGLVGRFPLLRWFQMDGATLELVKCAAFSWPPDGRWSSQNLCFCTGTDAQ